MKKLQIILFIFCNSYKCFLKNIKFCLWIKDSYSQIRDELKSTYLANRIDLLGDVFWNSNYQLPVENENQWLIFIHISIDSQTYSS